VVALLDPKPGERVLDIGCGDGVLTEAIYRTTGAVLGIDSSEEMVAATRLRGLEATVMSGEEITLVDSFDAVFSNAALHWMPRPRKVLSGVRRALVPGGRLVGEFGGAGNIARIVEAITSVMKETPSMGAFQNPWFFPSPAEYRALLEEFGFRVDYMELIERPTYLEHGIRGWLEVFANHVVGPMPLDAANRFLDDCETYLKPHLYDEHGGWWADYVRLRFRAYLDM
jgi:trans-aconitate methyltransferase